jgi:hypothetical protein
MEGDRPMATTKLEQSAAEASLEAALKDGRATRQELAIRSITVDPALQSRVATDPKHVEHLASLEAMGEELRPVVAFLDRKARRSALRRPLLADGFHRVEVRRRRGKRTIWAYVVEGTRADAVRYSAGANLANSKPTSREDRLKALEMLLSEPENVALSSNQLAKLCGLNDGAVAQHREAIGRRKGVEPPAMVVVTRVRNGKATTYLTARKRPAGAAADPMARVRRWAARLLRGLGPAEVDELIGLLKAGRRAGRKAGADG